LRRENIYAPELQRAPRDSSHDINVLAQRDRRSGTAAEQRRNSDVTAAELPKKQRSEQPGTAPGTAGLSSIIDHEKEPRRARYGRIGGTIA
jgi:hypothetical protein